MRLDVDRNGTLSSEEISQMVITKELKKFKVNWENLLQDCDTNGDGEIDFDEFISACIDTKISMNS